MNRIFRHRCFSILFSVLLCVMLAACGGGGGGSSGAGNGGGNSGGTSGGSGGGATGTGANTTRTGANVVPVTVSNNIFNTANEPLISLKICSASNACATIDNILVDTGSVGLRIFSSTALSALGLSHATISGNPIGECLQFVQGNTWGPVMLANLQVGGKTASNIAMQLINDPTFASAPAACTNSGTLMNTPNDFGANGVLGIGLTRQDCGDLCELTSNVENIYFSCASNTCTNVGIPNATQIQNPVSTFSSDNNGAILSFNAISTGGALSAAGTLTFGIDTAANNVSQNLNTMLVDPYGNIVTTFENRTYTGSYIDSGSNGLFFNPPSNSITQCTGDSAGFYCPTSNTSLTAQIAGQTGSTAAASVTFYIGNANTLFGSPNYAFNNLGGTATDIPGQGLTFDWGLPFFFGRDVYVAFEGAKTTKGAGPYFGF